MVLIILTRSSLQNSVWLISASDVWKMGALTCKTPIHSSMHHLWPSFLIFGTYHFLFVLYLLVYYLKWLILTYMNHGISGWERCHPWNLRFSAKDIPGSHRPANATGEAVATVLMLALDALITRCLGIVPLSIAVCSCKMLISVFRISSFFLLGVVGHLVQIGLSLSI
jgi:hypothetical protein